VYTRVRCKHDPACYVLEGTAVQTEPVFESSAAAAHFGQPEAGIRIHQVYVCARNSAHVLILKMPSYVFFSKKLLFFKKKDWSFAMNGFIRNPEIIGHPVRVGPVFESSADTFRDTGCGYPDTSIYRGGALGRVFLRGFK
jgi:hypothetical protein